MSDTVHIHSFELYTRNLYLRVDHDLAYNVVTHSTLDSGLTFYTYEWISKETLICFAYKKKSWEPIAFHLVAVSNERVLYQTSEDVVV